MGYFGEWYRILNDVNDAMDDLYKELETLSFTTKIDMAKREGEYENLAYRLQGDYMPKVPEPIIDTHTWYV